MATIRVRPIDKLDKACTNANDACATPQRRPHHELAWIWTNFLSEQHWANDLVQTADGRAANDSLHDARTRLKISSQ